MTTDETPLPRRSFLRSLGVVTASAITVGSVPSVAADEGDTSFTTTDPVQIESFDGTTIEASLFVPDAEGPHPAILMTHGWGGTRSDRRPLAKFYASNGYVVLTYDSRGFGNSGGEVTVNGPNEVGDAQRLITWLADHEAVQTDGPENPRIGMDGYSYGAGIQLATAIEDDRLDALVPRWGWWDLAYSNAPDDVLKWAWFYALVLSGRVNGDIAPEFDALSQQAVEERDAPDALREFWTSRSPVGDLDQVDTPTLLISGWEDRLFPANEPINNYEGLVADGTETRLLMYDFGHDFEGSNPTPRQLGVAQQSALTWMNSHLKGADTTLPPVQLYSRQEDSFAAYDTLPQARRTVELGEQARGGSTHLSTKQGAGATATFDVSFDDSVTIAGVPSLSLRVTPTGRRTHLFAALSDVGPDEEVLIKDQVAATEITDPGRIEFDLHGVERTIASDRTLRLTLTLDDDELTNSASMPFDTGLYVDSGDPAGAVVHHSKGHSAELTLPVVED